MNDGTVGTTTRQLQPFAELSDRGRWRRLRAVARQAVDAYGLRSAQISFAAESFNTVFRLVDSDGNRYALRVGSTERIHPRGIEVVEATWMKSLRSDTALCIPAVHEPVEGHVPATISAPGVPNARDCMLFDWAPGAVLRKRATERRLREAGRELAVLHEHAAFPGTEVAPDGAMVGNHVLYFSDHKRLDELRPRFGSLLDEATCRAQEHFDVLWKHPPHPPHLLHGDYTWHNILSTRNRLTIIDFQDLLWGFELQDVMIALFPFDRVNEGIEMGAWFRSGYESVRPWPVNDRDLFAALLAARRLLQVNLACNLHKPGFDEYVQYHADKLREWMKHGATAESLTRLSE